MLFEDRLLKFIEVFTMFTLKLYGLWPYCFDSKSRTFSTNAFLLIYSMTFQFVTLILFLIYNFLIFANLKTQFTSFVIYLIDNLFVYLIAISCIALWIELCLKRNKVKRLLINGLRVYESNTRQNRDGGSGYLRLLIMFLLKSLIYDCLYSGLIVVSPLQESTATNFANFFGGIVISLVPMVVRVVPNLYYGCILCGRYYYRRINNRLKLLWVTIKQNSENKTPIHESICDELAKLCVDHTNLTKLINECNDICSFQVVLLVVNRVFELIFQIIFRTVVLKRGTIAFDDIYLLTNFIFFVLPLFDLYTTFAVCEHIACEVIIYSNLSIQ